MENTGKRDVVMIAVAEPEDLSRADLKILEEVSAQTKDWTDAQLYRFVHDPKNIPEYEEPPPYSSIPIDPSALLAILGKSPEEVEAIRRRLQIEQIEDSVI